MNETRLYNLSALTRPVLLPGVKKILRGGGIERLPLVFSDLLGWIIRHIDSFHLKAQIIRGVAESVEIDRVGKFLPVVLH
jgi:hypothetical protein